MLRVERYWVWASFRHFGRQYCGSTSRFEDLYAINDTTKTRINTVATIHCLLTVNLYYILGSVGSSEEISF